METAKQDIESEKRFFDINKEGVKSIVGRDNVQGPEGVNSIQTYKDIDLTLGIIDHLINNVHSIDPNYTINLSSLTTLYVENLFSEMREGNDMPTVLEFAYKFYSCIKERIKVSTKTSFSYFTSPKSYYSKEKYDARVQLIRAKCIKKSISKEELYDLRDWRCENGQSVRQMTVRNFSTKDKPGTLPMNC